MPPPRVASAVLHEQRKGACWRKLVQVGCQQPAAVLVCWVGARWSPCVGLCVETSFVLQHLHEPQRCGGAEGVSMVLRQHIACMTMWVGVPNGMCVEGEALCYGS